jgi:hypothetical protein
MVTPALFLLSVVVIGLPDSAFGQAKAHIMDLMVETHEDGTKECVGDPNVLRVKAGDIVVLRAKGVPVQHVRWRNPKLQAQLPEKALSKQADNEAGFAAGSTFVLSINDEIDQTSVYFLDVQCGEEPDGPPVIIVDP